jgi:Gpi18-like mannosyltransferase
MGAGLDGTASPGREETTGRPRTASPSATTEDAGRPAWTPALVAILVAGIAAAFIVRLVLLPSEGLRGDLDIFAWWTHLLATEVPLDRVYEHDLSFGPVMAYVFRAIAQLAPVFQGATDAADPLARAWLKLPAVAADVGIVALVAYALRERPRVAVASALAVALVPVTWYLSGFWGQYESVYTLFGLLAAVLALRGRWALAGVALALALGTKPQAIPFVVPLGAFAVARLGWRGAAVPVAATAATLVVLWLPFVGAGGPAAYLASTTAYQGETFAVLSVRAWNPWWILQWAVAGEGAFALDGGALVGPITPRTLGYAAAALGLLLVFVALRRGASERALWLALAAAVLLPYCLLTSMHERYAYPAVVFLALLLVDRRVLAAWVVLVVGLSANLVAAAPPGGEPGSLVPLWGAAAIAGSLAVTGVAVYVLALLVRDAPPGAPERTDAAAEAAGPA